MYRKIISSFFLTCISLFVKAQSVFMHESQEDSSENIDGMGILLIIIIGIIVYVISVFYKSYKDDKTQSTEGNKKQGEDNKKGDYPATLKISFTEKEVNSVPQTKEVKKDDTDSQKTNEPLETGSGYISSDGKELIKGKDIEVVIVPEGIERIKDKAFDGFKNVKEVVLPKSLIEIGSWAFEFSSLERVHIPGNIKKIGIGVFNNCGNLKEVVVEEGVRNLGSEVFRNCDSLKSVSLPESLEYIPKSAFDTCVSLVIINLPHNLKEIGDYAFADCQQLEGITIPESVKSIGLHAFSGCYELKEIKIPKQIIGISEYTFYDDSKLEKVELPDTLTCIMAYAFGNCTSLCVKLPQTLSHLDEKAFSQCRNLRLQVPKGKKEWIESICDDAKGHVTEYNPLEIISFSEQLKSKTSSFLSIHKAKEQDHSDEILDDFMGPMHHYIKRNEDLNDDLYFNDEFDDYDNF